VRSDSWQPGHRSRLRLQALGRSGSAMRARRNDPGTGLARSRLGIGYCDAGLVERLDDALFRGVVCARMNSRTFAWRVVSR